jgi:hypothetical protein
MPRRRRSDSQRRQRMRRLGYAAYVAGALVVLVGLVVVLRDEPSPPAEHTDHTIPEAKVIAAAPTVPTTATTTIPLAPGQTAPASGINAAPVISGPRSVSVHRGKATAIPGVSVADADAKADDTIGVLVSSKQGTVVFGTTDGVQFTTKNGSERVAFSGTLAAINKVLASLRFTAKPVRSGTVSVYVNDNGGGIKRLAKADRFSIAVRVVP